MNNETTEVNLTLLGAKVMKGLRSVQINEPKSWGLCDPKWVYVPASQTGVTVVWRAHGWLPLSERR